MQGEDVVEDLKNKAQDVEAQLTATVRERPIASLATALGIGYLLALPRAAGAAPCWKLLAPPYLVAGR